MEEPRPRWGGCKCGFQGCGLCSSASNLDYPILEPQSLMDKMGIMAAIPITQVINETRSAQLWHVVSAQKMASDALNSYQQPQSCSTGSVGDCLRVHTSTRVYFHTDTCTHMTGFPSTCLMALVCAYTLHLPESFPRKVKSIPLGPGHSCSCGRMLGRDERVVPSSPSSLLSTHAAEF